MILDPVEFSLVDRWQRDFPLVPQPFACAGQPLGLDESATMAMFRRLQQSGVITRLGAVVKPHAVGASTLAAMRVPAERLEEVAAIVTREPAVNHNYERTHDFNLWFVIAAPDAAAVAATIRRIEQATELCVLDLPLLEAYHLDLGFSLTGTNQPQRRSVAASADYRVNAIDRGLLDAIADGLPIVARPYREVADELGLDEDDVIERLQQLAQAGVISRFGCVVRHRALGYTANAMAVWDVADDLVGDVAARFARHPGVTLCYRRPRRLPDWRYNLFCMIHAKARPEALAVIDALNLAADTGRIPQAVLFSLRCFKQRGAIFSH